MLSEAVPASVKGMDCLKGIVGKYKNVVSVQKRTLRMHFGKLTFRINYI